VAKFDPECVFCQRIEDQAYDHYDTLTVAFRPLNPVTPGHMLVIPRRHVADASQIAAVAGQTMYFAAKLAQDLGEDYNILTSKGPEATQTVFHLHLHLIPRRSGDGLLLPWSNQLK